MTFESTFSKQAEERDERLALSVPYYRFQPSCLNRLSELSREKIRFSDPAKFNDPFDLGLQCKKSILPEDEVRLRQALRIFIKGNPDYAPGGFYNDELLHYLDNWLDGNLKFNFLIDKIENRFKDFGVVCLTPILENTLMWAHYAESHTGYCIEYSAKRISLALGSDRIKSYDAQYTSKLSEFSAEEVLFTPRQFIHRMIASKGDDWAYEKEWRLVNFESKEKYADIPYGLELSALIAGQKASRELVVKLIEKAKELKIPAYRFTLSSKLGHRLELLESN